MRKFSGCNLRVPIVVFLLIVPFFLHGQNKPLVSVLPFSAQSVSEGEAQTISRLFEGELTKTNVFTVVAQSDATRILQEQAREIELKCSDISCAIKIGEFLQAQDIFIGDLSKVESIYVLTIRIVDISKANILKSEDVKAGSLQGIMDQLGAVANVLKDVGVVTAGKASIIAEEEAQPSGDRVAASVLATSSYVRFDSTPAQVPFSIFDATGKFLVLQRKPYLDHLPNL